VLGIIICVIYWAMMILGQTFSVRNGMNGIISMWLPDALVFAAGLAAYAGLKRK